MKFGNLFGANKNKKLASAEDSIWNTLKDTEGITVLKQNSSNRPQLVFKHSTRCGISRMVWSQSRGVMEGLGEKADLHFLDLLANRNVSDAIAQEFGVKHESPQVLLIRDGEVIAHASHSAIPQMAFETYLK